MLLGVAGSFAGCLAASMAESLAGSLAEGWVCEAGEEEETRQVRAWQTECSQQSVQQCYTVLATRYHTHTRPSCNQVDKAALYT